MLPSYNVFDAKWYRSIFVSRGEHYVVQHISFRFLTHKNVLCVYGQGMKKPCQVTVNHRCAFELCLFIRNNVIFVIIYEQAGNVKGLIKIAYYVCTWCRCQVNRFILHWIMSLNCIELNNFFVTVQWIPIG